MIQLAVLGVAPFQGNSGSKLFQLPEDLSAGTLPSFIRTLCARYPTREALW